MHRSHVVTLETLVAVVEADSFSRAAEKLETTPGAVSRRVSALEERLGLRLLNRTTRKVSLTEAGEQYYRDVSGILQALVEAENRISHPADEPTGTLRVATPLSFGVRALVPRLPGFAECFPGLRVALDLDDRIVDILATRADVAPRIGPLADSSQVGRRIGEIKQTLCATPRHVFRSRNSRVVRRCTLSSAGRRPVQT